MYIMYARASNTNSSYIHISLYVVWRVHPQLVFYTLVITMGSNLVTQTLQF